MKSILISFIVLLLAHTSLKAQFDKKLTFDFSVAYASPLGDKLQEDRLPYFFSNLDYGISVAGDVQYNLSKSISIGVQGDFTGFYSWTDPRIGAVASNENSFFNVFAVNPFIKYRILKSKLSPFIMGSIGAAYYYGQRAPAEFTLNNYYLASPNDFWVSIDQVIIREPGQEVERKIVPNSIMGAGLDYNLSQTLGVFLMANFNVIYANNDNVLRQNLQYFMIAGGVNVNFVKSKTL